MRFRKRKNILTIESDYRGESIPWISFYFGIGFSMMYNVCGYFDNRPNIHLQLLFFTLNIYLPFRNKWEDECDGPSYGIAIHNNTFWVYKGGKGNYEGNKWWTWDIPFFSLEWIRTSVLLKDDTWEHETKGNKKDFYKTEWKAKQKSWTYDYIDNYDGEVIPTIIYVVEREWRPKWLTWTKLFATKVTRIEVEFSKEVGSAKGSWKGGTLGCSYALLKNETPLDCLKRMEKERV